MTDKIISELLKEQLLIVVRQVLAEYLQGNIIYLNQEFRPLEEMVRRYTISPSTIRNYHEDGILDIRRMQPEKRSKLFVSIIELENHLRNNPLPRHEK